MQAFRTFALVAVLYLLTGFVSRSLANASTQTLAVWLASGVTFSALLVGARWSWPPVLLGAGAASAIWGVIAHDLGLGGALAFGAIEIVSMAVGAAVATLGRPNPERPAGAALLITGALVGSALGGLLAVLLWRWQRPGADLSDEWLAWSISTAVGLLLVAPVVTAFRGFRVRRSGGMGMQPFLGGALAFFVFVGVTVMVFGPRATQQFGALASTLAYLPMPFLLIAVVLWGARGGSLAMLLGALLIIGLTAQGGGPFAIAEGFPGESVIEVQGFIAAWAVVILLARALDEARRVSLDQARQWRLRYERTLQAVGVASVEYDATTGRATWGEGAAQVFGPAIHGVNSLTEWLDRIDPAERGLVQATWSAIARGDVAASEQEYGVTLGSGPLRRVREQLANVRGGDDAVEQVVALLRIVPSGSRP